MFVRTHRWIGISLAVAVSLVFAFVGCKDKNDAKAVKAPSVQVEPKKDNNGKAIPAKPVSFGKEPKLFSFRDAVILDPAPEGEVRPPDTACNGKNIAKIFEAIANDLWDNANFKDATGKPARYQAIMTTDLGEIHIDLYHDIAPNHVRNFVAVARSGYYDGMPFYYSFHDIVEGTKVAWIESGCPKGTGEDGYGSVGYWLKSEFSEKITHEPGTIGACLRVTDDTAACRFYITAVALPKMDGKFTAFGKVTKGLDVVHTINTRPLGEMGRPKDPVLIKSVTIRAVSE